ncbi:MAG: Dipeptide transport system permease protein DppB [Chlamydiae bacterium]|nr:Dipeptide transport system permease protein DppB [Chlamydiota bacterium]
MIEYLIRRILLLPVTLFAIILVNFVILNLAPGEPANMAQVSATGEASRSTDQASGGDNQYLVFREHYGLTLPILFNPWPSISEEKVRDAITTIAENGEELSSSDLHHLKILWGDRARFVMPHFLSYALDLANSLEQRKTAANFFIRGGVKQGYVGPTLTKEESQENRVIARQNLFLQGLHVSKSDTVEETDAKISQLIAWYKEHGGEEAFTYKGGKKAKTLLFETRFFRYLKRVMTLDFGTLRNDNNKLVIHEVGSRIKYSLTLALIPMVVTFILCQFFGMWMATHQNQWPDYSLNVLFLILFAIPIFVVAPFLIEKIALHRTIPFTQISIPYSGFHSPEAAYDTLTSTQRLGDVALHLFLPLVAIMYGTLAIQARISRTAFLEVLRQDFVRTAQAKGLPRQTVLWKHVGRNGAITIVTSLAASLGVILGGSLIVETIFEINGFGRFFYEAIVNRDYNVVLFSAFAGSFLTLIGYLLADICYTFLDPRVSLWNPRT